MFLCRLQDETINHIFVECKFAIKLWSDLRHYCQSSFVIPILNPQSAIFGFFETDPDLVILLNHILLLYKYYIYSSRDSSKLSFKALLKNIKIVMWLKLICVLFYYILEISSYCHIVRDYALCDTI